MRHEPEKNQEVRRMKIMNSTLNDPRDFEIIIFKWGDGVQALKLRSTFLNLFNELRSTAPLLFKNSSISNESTDRISLDMEHLDHTQTSTLPQ